MQLRCVTTRIMIWVFDSPGHPAEVDHVVVRVVVVHPPCILYPHNFCCRSFVAQPRGAASVSISRHALNGARVFSAGPLAFGSNGQL